MEESRFEVDDIKAYTSFAQPSVHHHALSKNKVGLNFYHRVQRFSIDDSDGTLACTGLDPRTHLPSPSPTRKRVTFDSKVKTYEHSAVEESVELFEEKKDEEVKPLKSRQDPCSSEGSHVTSNSSGSYPPKHRYQNCRESDDEDEHVTDCDDSDDDGSLLDDYYEDKWDNEVYTEDNVVLDIEKSNGSAARDRSGNVNALLNPIENLTQWKAVISKGRTIETRSLKEQNANLISDQEHKLNASFSPLVSELSSFSIKQKSRDETKKQRTREVAVDASLSTSQTTQSFSRKPIRSGERCSLLQRFHP